ncbi:response regulator receiver protein [Poseidonocella pacifica]|uniref:Response regulator receiver protein n=1 Tax=Poseidonocella pacifica TaxID=871651 RepID=A0A1I0WHU3_9RHOB|nr:response regulator [Poseidonocella pacifica]SFA88345.1 response regulator receiver protein [Poseidonocella pacifica]
MDDLDPLALTRTPTPARPLLGLTVLVVEDSRFACEAMRLLCLRSGARIRRADSLTSARRHLQVYRPSVVIVDLGLPDGAGEDLIEEMASMPGRTCVILGISGDESGSTRAMSAGADGFLAKPVKSLAVFQEAVLAHIPAEHHPRGPRVISEDVISPDPIAFQDDIAHAAEVLSGADGEYVVDYVSQFLAGLARTAEDAPLANAVAQLEEKRQAGQRSGQDVELFASFLKSRLDRKIAI